MSIGSRLKDARLARGLTQEGLAKLVGVTKGAIGNYETGVSSPKETVLFRLMQELTIDANYIYQDYFNPDNARVIPYGEAQETLRIFLTEDEYEELTLYRGADPIYQQVAKDVLRAHQREKKNPS